MKTKPRPPKVLWLVLNGGDAAVALVEHEARELVAAIKHGRGEDARVIAYVPRDASVERLVRDVRRWARMPECTAEEQSDAYFALRKAVWDFVDRGL